MILCYGALKLIIIYYIGNNMYTETVQALSIILEGYKITLKNLMLIVNVHVLIYPKTHTD